MWHCLQQAQEDASHFEVAVRSISVSLKTQIINRSYDEVAICFFNTVSLRTFTLILLPSLIDKKA